MDKKHYEFDELIQACLDDRLSEIDAERLSALIEESPDVRERYWELASIHGMLEQSLQQASVKALTGENAQSTPKKSGSAFRWHPLTAAAAGVALGVCSATVLFAYSLPFARNPAPEIVDVFFESFEDEAMEPKVGFPNRSGKWFGNISVAATSEQGIPSADGSHVATLEPVPTRKFAYARRIIDLTNHLQPEDGSSRQLDVSASFYSGDPVIPAQYQIRLAAFSQEPSAVRPIWNDEVALYDTVLQHVGRNVVTKSGDSHWQVLRTSMEIPSDARSLVISLGAGGADRAHPTTEHFLDAVEARLIYAPAPTP